MPELLYREALRRALDEEMARDPHVFLLGETIAERGGSFKVTEGLLARYGPERVIDTPIAEASFTGMAVGAALIGLRPVVELLFIDFALLAMDQIVNQAAKIEFISGGRRRLPLVIRTQGGVGEGLAAQHSQSLEALFYHVPGLKVVMPATPADAYGLLKSAIRDDHPVVFIEHKRLYAVSGPVPEEETLLPLGCADWKRRGGDVTLVSWSYMVHRCLAAAERLAERGIEAEVLDLRSLVPLDRKALLASARKTGRVLIVHEAVRRGGVGGDLAATIMEEAWGELAAPVRRLAGRNTPIPYSRNLEEACIPSVDEIAAAAAEIAAAGR
ncbi:MAG: alpha-ketoacid dehydrogenase subunit beta [Desulfobacterales bacterium]